VTAECSLANDGNPTDTINGGVYHLVNYGSTTRSKVSEPFGASAGISGQTNEVIGSFAYSVLAVTNANSANPINAWGNNALSASGPANGLLANLICQTSGMAMDNGGSTAAGHTVIQWTQGGGNTNQEWMFNNGASGGYYTLTCQTSGMALSDPSGSKSAGAVFLQETLQSGDTDEEFLPVSVGNGWYNLINLTSGLALDNGGATSNGTTLQQKTLTSNDSNQNWEIEPIGAPLIQGGVYHLICVTSGMALDNEGSLTAGTPCRQWASQTTNTNQEWELVGTDNTDDYYNLICGESGMALDGNNATGNDTPVVQEPLTAGDANQEWELVLGNGSYNLICLASGLALDNEGSTTQGNGIWQATPIPGDTNQEWQFVINNSAPQSGSVYNLICDTGGLALDNGGSTTNGGVIVQESLTAGDTNQEWGLTSASTSGYYTLTNQTSGQALDNGGSTTQGAYVMQETLTSGDANQEWKIVSDGGGLYRLINLTSGQSLDNGGSTSAGSDVKQWSTQPSSNQAWEFLLPEKDTFAQWISLYLNPQQLANPAISGAAATPQNDGTSNLLKYFYDINPSAPMTASDWAAMAAVGMTTNGNIRYLTLTYRQNALATGVTVNVQTSSDLKTWQTVTPDFTQTVGTDSVTGDPIIEIGVNVNGLTRKFINLNATSP
jgi:hypothetical protein